VDIVLSHAGADGRIVDALLALPPAVRPEGLVVAGTGNGTVHEALLAALQRAQASGVRVWRTTRCAYGPLLSAGEHPVPAAAETSAVKARVALMLELLAP
jgi:L-asparaginase